MQEEWVVVIGHIDSPMVRCIHVNSAEEGRKFAGNGAAGKSPKTLRKLSEFKMERENYMKTHEKIDNIVLYSNIPANKGITA